MVSALLFQSLYQVPALEDDYGYEAAEQLHALTRGKALVARVEERDASAGTRVKGQGTGITWVVTLVDSETSTSVNAALLQVRRQPAGHTWS